ncbi:MAG: cysteine desulfurase NifS [Actinobacteria bacterium RBG_16_64_13]|nr:MAG: cysteine desulfurase NifS [Actinobacteria bacterium RBG_16_64_13]
MFGETVYLDNAAATRLDERVLEAMKPYFFDTYAVATSEFGYSMGIEAREALEQARTSLASRLGAHAEEFIFTSGSTESSNMALKGVALALGEKKGRHLVTSRIEDFPVLNTAAALGKSGFRVSVLDVDGDGLLDPVAVEKAIAPDTILVSIQHGNQEIGTVQDVESIAKTCQAKGILFHVDATHSFTRLPLDVNRVPVDLVTVAGHTIHGPKGVGGLYVRTGTPLGKWMDGGFQELNRRAGVEDISGAVGFARAAELVTAEENDRLRALRDRLLDRALSEIPYTTLNGHRTRRLPQNANITFHFVEGESITLHLDMRGFAVSTGSACFSKSLEASHVILGIGGDHERAHGSVRFSLGRYNTEADVDGVLDAIAEVVAELRAISPLTPND